MTSHSCTFLDLAAYAMSLLSLYVRLLRLHGNVYFFCRKVNEIYPENKVLRSLTKSNTIANFTVVCSVTWPLDRNEAEVHSVFLQT